MRDPSSIDNPGGCPATTVVVVVVGGAVVVVVVVGGAGVVVGGVGVVGALVEEVVAAVVGVEGVEGDAEDGVVVDEGRNEAPEVAVVELEHAPDTSTIAKSIVAAALRRAEGLGEAGMMGPVWPMGSAFRKRATAAADPPWCDR